MKGNLDIEKLFQDKLGNLESPVSPDVWANISSAIGNAGAAASGATVVQTGMSGLMKSLLIGGGIVTAGLITTYVVINTNGPDKEKAEAPVIADRDIVVENINDGLKFDQAGDTAIEGDRATIAKELKNVSLPDQTLTPEMVEQILIEIKDSDMEAVSMDEIIKSVQEEFSTADLSGESNSVTEETAAISESETEVLQDLVEPSTDQEEEVISQAVINCEFNVFTPNGDGVNEVWPISFENVQEVFIQIIAENGKVVLTSNDAQFSWDGLDQSGLEVENGIYYIYIVATDADNKSIVKRGAIEVR